ncbi:MAG: glycosyltransferase, partial [Actinomycetota bacterium]|nr:glycosyltransferase [Actinomycetota bacterium]
TLEAMSASTPVVLANAMALPHLVREGSNGYLFTPGDSSDLAQKITTILQLPAEDRAAMGEASHEMVEKHGLAKTLDTFEDLYRGGRYEDYAV